MLTFAVALILALVHLLGGRIQLLNVIPRSRWLSAAGGVSVAYVFMHILPQLQEHHNALMEEVKLLGSFWFFEHYIFLLAMLGLVMSYGMECFAKRHVPRIAEDDEDATPSLAFWLHIGAFGLYNVLVGYLLLHREEMDMRGLFLFALAMSLHFLVNDKALRNHHGRLYRRYARWILAASPLVGWGIATQTEVHTLVVSTLFAFLAGGIILNVLKEELPEERESSFRAFAGGAFGYAALLFLVK